MPTPAEHLQKPAGGILAQENNGMKSAAPAALELGPGLNAPTLPLQTRSEEEPAGRIARVNNGINTINR